MLRTFLTEQWGLRYPLIGAPMAGVAFGRLARAVSAGGALGMIGIGSSDPVSKIADESRIAGEGGSRFGIGLMAWALEKRPELLDAAIAAQPFAISFTAGSVAPYVSRVRDAGIKCIAQINSRADALEAERAGAHLLVAQGTEAGGHTGDVATLPLLQIVLDAVRVPVVASGGIATARGLAAVLAAGAQGAWIGTPFLASPEAGHSSQARARIVEAREDETVLTRLFDRTLGIPWPERFPGRALVNDFTRRWNERQDEAAASGEAAASLRGAVAAKDYSTAYIYAGQSVGSITSERPAPEVIASIGDGAETLLRDRHAALLGSGARRAVMGA
jgi:nitronate monooxygenase